MPISTRDYAKIQDKRNAKLIRGKVQINSGATGNRKGDSYNEGTNWSILVEGKTTAAKEYEHGVRQKTIKLEWLTKVASEAFSMGKRLWALAFSFDNKKDYYILDEINFRDLYQGVLDYEEENEKLKNEINDLKEQVKNLSNEIDKNILEMTKLQDEIYELKDQLNKEKLIFEDCRFSCYQEMDNTFRATINFNHKVKIANARCDFETNSVMVWVLPKV